MSKLIISRPSDFHLHFREGSLLNLTVPHVANYFRYVVAMPNLSEPIVNIEQALSYRESILASQTEALNEAFFPLMALYLQETTPISLIKVVAKRNEILGFKLYPQGVTTLSSKGVGKIEKIYPVLEEMEKEQVPLLIHGEQLINTDGKVIDVFDREKYFIDNMLIPILQNFPTLKVTMEHITTKEAVSFVSSASDSVAATVTSHHLYLNRNDMLADGIKPHYYCKPIVKRESHRVALLEAVTSGHKRFFMGSDSAPHLRRDKESSCGCAGLYTAPQNLALYAEIFYQSKSLNQLEGFLSVNGCRHYGLPLEQLDGSKDSKNKISLCRVEQGDQMDEGLRVPSQYAFRGAKEGDVVIPFKAGELLKWKVSEIKDQK